MNYTIDTALAVSFIIGTAMQVLFFVSSIALRRAANKALDKAQSMSEEANSIAAEAEKTHNGALLCLMMSNKLFFCKSSDERANVIIKWIQKLQEAGIDLDDIDEIINN